MHNNNQQFNENLEQGDLKRLVQPELHIDEYKSKMGEDDDVCVVSFKINGKEAAADMVSFIEKGYDYILDADVSSGEKSDGDYLIFVEIDRTAELPKQIMEIVADLENLTDLKTSDWHVKYQKDHTSHELTEEQLAKIIPLTPDDYTDKFTKYKNDLDQMKATAHVPVDTKAPKNEYTESLRIAAGIK